MTGMKCEFAISRLDSVEVGSSGQSVHKGKLLVRFLLKGEPELFADKVCLARPVNGRQFGAAYSSMDLSSEGPTLRSRRRPLGHGPDTAMALASHGVLLMTIVRTRSALSLAFLRPAQNAILLPFPQSSLKIQRGIIVFVLRSKVAWQHLRK